MIIRQFSARHGRSALANSAKYLRRNYANEVDLENQAIRQSERDQKPKPVIPGHPDDPSSILDTSQKVQTPNARAAAEEIEKVHQSIAALQSEVNAFVAGKNHGIIPPRTPTAHQNQLPKPPFQNPEQMYNAWRDSRRMAKKGSVISQVYHPWTVIEKPPTTTELTLPMLLANQTHLGHATALWNPANSRYIFGVRDGIHIISLDITLSYLRRAARVVHEVARRGGIILFVGTRKGQQQITVNAAKRAGGYHVFSKWRPGSLTNGQQILGRAAIKVVGLMDQEIEKYRESIQESAHPALRPDLVVCLNPLENEVCLHECGVYNVPTIGIIDTDANPGWVTYPIPANDDSLRSVALIAGTLGRAGEEGQKLRLEAAQEGRATYNTSGVNRLLKTIEELTSLGVHQIADGGGGQRRGEGKDEDKREGKRERRE